MRRGCDFFSSVCRSLITYHYHPTTLDPNCRTWRKSSTLSSSHSITRGNSDRCIHESKFSQRLGFFMASTIGALGIVSFSASLWPFNSWVLLAHVQSFFFATLLFIATLAVGMLKTFVPIHSFDHILSFPIVSFTFLSSLHVFSSKSIPS